MVPIRTEWPNPFGGRKAYAWYLTMHHMMYLFTKSAGDLWW